MAFVPIWIAQSMLSFLIKTFTSLSVSICFKEVSAFWIKMNKKDKKILMKKRQISYIWYKRHNEYEYKNNIHMKIVNILQLA